MVSPESYYQIENWCDVLKDDTFKTEYFGLEYEEADAICKVHEVITLLHQIELQEMNSPQIYLNADWLNGARMPPLTLFKFLHEEETQPLLRLEQKIEDAIQKMGGSAFIRLSTRSPKDSALRTPKMRNIIKEIISAEPDNGTELSEQEKDIRNMHAFTIACQKTLQVRSGKEAVSLLYQSNRASHDVRLQKLHLGEENFSMNVVAREWHDIPTIWEFRTLVYNNEITVITHYYENCYVKEIVEREEEIVRRIRAKFEELNKLIPIDTYTIDFCVDPNSDKVWLIEVNNPPPIAGVSFLDYKNEEERKIIENGPFCFMMNREPLKDPYKGVEPILVRYMKYLRGDLGTIENIGFHPDIECSHCGMNPFYGERFCCIECGGAEYDLDSDTLISPETEAKHDTSAYNICCFCYADRIHDPEHHFIVYIDDGLICESQLNSYRHVPKEKNHQVSNDSQDSEVSVPESTGLCKIL